MAGPQFIKYFAPVISALKMLGNSGKPAEVRKVIAEQLKLTNADLNAQMDSGGARFENQVAWARFYLSKADYLDTSKRGVWTLTEKGQTVKLTGTEALKIFQEIQKKFKETTINLTEDAEVVEEEKAPTENVLPASDYRIEFLERMKNLPPTGFEKLCQRLLREYGFENLEVTGQTGDGGIDGRGVLRINPMISYRVAFQCKRYKNAVGSPLIRDFRGSLDGRVEKGIFFTTAAFTDDAQKEAKRDGAIAIELVDGKLLVGMFEELELGLKPIQTFEVDSKFFNEFE